MRKEVLTLRLVHVEKGEAGEGAEAGMRVDQGRCKTLPGSCLRVPCLALSRSTSSGKTVCSVSVRLSSALSTSSWRARSLQLGPHAVWSLSLLGCMRTSRAVCACVCVCMRAFARVRVRTSYVCSYVHVYVKIHTNTYRANCHRFTQLGRQPSYRKPMASSTLSCKPERPSKGVHARSDVDSQRARGAQSFISTQNSRSSLVSLHTSSRTPAHVSSSPAGLSIPRVVLAGRGSGGRLPPL